MKHNVRWIGVIVATLVLSVGLLGTISQATDEPVVPWEEMGVSCWGPAWSPDGTKIAYSSEGPHDEPAEDDDIYVVTVQSGQTVRLTTDPAEDKHPAWSPDGSRIAWTSHRTGHPEVWVMNADGTSKVQLTTSEPSELPTAMGNTGGAWCPDGLHIAFSTSRDGMDSDIMLMTADGEELRYLAASPDDEGGVTWSPDGQKIAFSRSKTVSRNPFREAVHIWRRNIDMTALTQLTFSPPGSSRSEDGGSSWSPDGSKIAFTRFDPEADKRWNVYLVNAAGGEPYPLFPQVPGAGVSDPDWSPDGSKIAFVGWNPNHKGTEVFYANADGTGITQVTHLNDQ